MNILSPDMVKGDLFQLRTTHPRHVDGMQAQFGEMKTGEGSFGNILASALDQVNAMEQESSRLVDQSIMEPDSVDVHDITIAMSKANLAVSVTKAVVDGALKAYNDIINIR